MKNNVYLGKIVTFDNYSLLFEIDNLQPISEEFRLISVFGKNAYDLITKERYYVLELASGLIVDDDLYNLKQGIKYVYEVYPFIDVWENIKDVYNIKYDMDTFVNRYLKDTEELNKILTEDKIIDINKIKRIIKRK